MMFQSLVLPFPLLGILGSQGTASNQKPSAALSHIQRYTAPQKLQHIERSMVGMHASATQFDDLRPQPFVRRKIKLPLTIIPDVCAGTLACLQTVCSYDIAGRNVLNNQVIADGIERISIEPIYMGLHQSFVQFEIKNLKP